MDRSWYAFYEKDVPRSINYPVVTLKELFNRNAEEHPDRPYLVMGDITLPYRVCNLMARRLANGLLRMGANKGDRVGLVMPNIPQYPISLMACYKIGAIAVPANPLYTTPELAYQFRDSGTETVIVLSLFADKVIHILQEGNTPVKRIIAVQITGKKVDLEQVPGLEDYEILTARSGCEEPAVALTPDDTAILQYTGGTTGVPKGCVLSHANLVAMLVQMGAWGQGVCPLDQVRTLATVPLYHVFGMNCNINLALCCAGTMVLVPQPTPDAIMDAINRHEPTIWAAVPTMIQGVLNHPAIGQSRIGRLRLVQCGGAPLPVEVMRRFEELAGIPIVEGYGMSETSNIVTANPPERCKPGSVGVPWPDVDVRIVDRETGTKEVPPGEPGEIIVKGPQVMAGYWNRPEETAKALRDGWLYTGDIGTMDDEGYLCILDRKKDMIICSGFNVYPREIEEILHANLKVGEACVIGVPDEKRGETVKAFVVVKPGESLTPREVTDFCAERLAPYKVPKIVELIEQLPKTPVGKPDRKALRAADAEKTETKREGATISIPIQPSTPNNFSLRLMEARDAAGVASCFQDAYGSSYFFEYVYDPERHTALNRAGETLSAVAVTWEGEVVSHLALVFSKYFPGVAEVARAVTKSSHRGQSLLKGLGRMLGMEAVRLGLTGLFTGAVTVHTYSQRAALNYGGFRDCGFFLARLPAGMYFKGIGEGSSQRTSEVISFLYLQRQDAAAEIHPPLRHRDMLFRIYDNLGLGVGARADGNRGILPEKTVVDLTITSRNLSAAGRIYQYGRDLGDRIRELLHRAKSQGLEVVDLFLDLRDPLTPLAAAELEEQGFGFSGILPGVTGGDLMIMQHFNGITIDYESMKLESTMASELRDYIRANEPPRNSY